MVNAADSLVAIRRAVFEEGRVGLAELALVLSEDFAGREELRALLVDCPKYGNDEDEADSMLARVQAQVCGAAIESGAQADFAIALASEAKAAGLGVCLDTSGQASPAVVEAISPFVDLFSGT